MVVEVNFAGGVTAGIFYAYNIVYLRSDSRIARISIHFALRSVVLDFVIFFIN